uniref:preprotein translocase subunit YajC n=1 Tax=Eubacterium cellulosolvens TaxID=29322 RepID=UPI0004870FBA|nr:preprotein translocase subunit YajC [[Eubacterium] cellulosolvens]
MILASANANAGAGSMMSMLIMIVAMFALMYFMMIRPQKKEQKRTQEMLSSMEIGDAVVTTSGFYGILIDISDDDVIVEFGNNKNCRIPMRKEAIALVEKPEQAAAAKEDKEKDAKAKK